MFIHVVIEVFNFLVIHCTAKHFEVKFVHKSRLYPEEQPMHACVLSNGMINKGTCLTTLGNLLKKYCLPFLRNGVGLSQVS